METGALSRLRCERWLSWVVCCSLRMVMPVLAQGAERYIVTFDGDNTGGSIPPPPDAPVRDWTSTIAMLPPPRSPCRTASTERAPNDPRGVSPSSPTVGCLHIKKASPRQWRIGSGRAGRCGARGRSERHLEWQRCGLWRFSIRGST